MIKRKVWHADEVFHATKDQRISSNILGTNSILVTPDVSKRLFRGDRFSMVDGYHRDILLWYRYDLCIALQSESSLPGFDESVFVDPVAYQKFRSTWMEWGTFVKNGYSFCSWCRAVTSNSDFCPAISSKGRPQSALCRLCVEHWHLATPTNAVKQAARNYAWQIAKLLCDPSEVSSARISSIDRVHMHRGHLGGVPPFYVTMPLPCYACAYCGEQSSQRDHLHPRALGGHDVFANIVRACDHCNASKGSKTAPEFLKILKARSIYSADQYNYLLKRYDDYMKIHTVLTQSGLVDVNAVFGRLNLSLRQKQAKSWPSRRAKLQFCSDETAMLWSALRNSCELAAIKLPQRT